ncbi:MAG TPA: hypothetical protein VGR81_07110 [Candidatus Acidoferrales bacterium]|nr:hypothetical protein [Candidatus Acidoferrales bacterium]
MEPDSKRQIHEAKTASSDALRAFLHETNEEILTAILTNPNLTESDVCIVLERLELTQSILGAIAQHPSWKKNEGVRVRMVRHPHCPRRIAITLLRQLFLFDLVEVSLLPSVPGEIRRLAEEVLLQRLPHLPIGEKLTLARRGTARVACGILGEGHPQAASLALNNPFLNEAQILRVLARTGVHERVVASIAKHPRWSCEYNVRMALIRHPAAPLAAVMRFLPDITMRDLHELSAAATLPENLRRYIRREVARRGGAKESHRTVEK